MGEKEKVRNKGKLTFAVHPRGLIVCGDTYALKETFKAEGGKWDAIGKGWVFPLMQKADLKVALRDSGEVGNIEDKATVKLTVVTSEKSVLVTGDTFQLKDMLKSEGGRWDPELKGWSFKASQKAEIIAELRASSLADVSVQSAPPAEPLQVRGRSSSTALVVSTPPRSKKGGDSSSGRKPEAASTRRQLAAQSGTSRKVVESAKQLRSVEQRADGSQANTKVQHRERKLSCKRTGAHLETQSVTKKKKVVETKGKIVETATITVKRVRRK